MGGHTGRAERLQIVGSGAVRYSICDVDERLRRLADRNGAITLFVSVSIAATASPFSRPA
jgi:hypothetical protein